MKYKVSVEKTLYCTGSVEVEADDPEQAEQVVDELINSCRLRTSDVCWEDPTYEEASLCTTGDVEEAYYSDNWVNKHSVNCLTCGKLVDERECLYGPDGEGSICPACQKNS